MLIMMPNGTEDDLDIKIPSFSEVIQKTEEVFGFKPCTWQIKVAIAMIKRWKDIVCVSGMGSGKTLPFWLPLFFTSGTVIVITALNILGQQNEKSLEKVGIRAIAISGDAPWKQHIRVSKQWVLVFMIQC